MKGLSLVSAITLCVVISQVTGKGLQVTTSETGYYQISVEDKAWLRGSQTFFYANGNIYTTEGRLGQLGNLTLRNTENDRGQDKIGVWKRITFNYYAGDKPIQLYIKTYLDNDNVIIFGQRYLEDTHGTKSLSHVKTIGGFPNFGFFFPAGQKLGYLQYAGNWMGDEDKSLTIYDFNQGLNVTDGYMAGPICLFSGTGSSLIISPFNQFMSASVNIDHQAYWEGFIHYGIMGTVDFIPAGFEYETIFYYNPNGVNKAFEGWGTLMREWYGKTDMRDKDLSLNSLGYWTDEGTAYYEKPEDDKNYEETILDLKTSMDQQNISYTYFELDDWFYERDENGGTVRWEAKNDSIPDGLTFLHEKTGLPVVLQNGFWSNSTPYAVDNGGNFTFLIRGSYAVPLGEDFWDFLFSQAKDLGLSVYQQDWMTEQTFNIPDFQTNVTLGRTWLMDMGNSAARHGITIQYSGALPRHALQSLEIPAVTQIRVSNDFGKSKNQWKIGVTSIFADALGLAPSKDSFLTSTNTTTNETNTMIELQSIVATLSTGPIGTGDSINSSNYMLSSSSCCNTEGFILGPSRPARAIDRQLAGEAFNDGSGPNGEVWTTYSMIGDLTFGIIFSRLEGESNFTGKMTDFFDSEFPESELYTLNAPDVLIPVNKDSSFFLCCDNRWPYYSAFYTSPVIKIGKQQTRVVILGEMWKHVPVSSKRTQSINVTSDLVTLTLVGVPGEEVNYYYAVDDEWNNIQFMFGSDRKKVITIEPKPVTTTAKPMTSPTTPYVGTAAILQPRVYIYTFVFCLIFMMRF